MRPLILLTVASIFSLSDNCFSQAVPEVVYGSMASKRIRMVQLRADRSFFMMNDTLEYRGTYARPNAGDVSFTYDDGTTVGGTINQDTLRIAGMTLPRWNRGTTAASFLSAFVKFRNLIQDTRAEIRRDIIELSRIAKQFRDSSGSYSGFAIPDEFKGREYVMFSVQVSADEIQLKGTSTKVDGAVQVTLLPDGRPTRWTYFRNLM